MIEKRRDIINVATDRGLSHGCQKGSNSNVRLVIRRAYGFHGPEAAFATVMLLRTCQPGVPSPHLPSLTCRAVEPEFLL